MSLPYSRYVPPKKSNAPIETSKPPEPEPQHSNIAASPPPALYASTPYARWVPPKKNTLTRSYHPSPPSLTKTQQQQRQDNEEPRSRKRRKVKDEDADRPKHKNKKKNNNKSKPIVPAYVEEREEGEGAGRDEVKDVPSEPVADLDIRLRQLAVEHVPEIEIEIESMNGLGKGEAQSDLDADSDAQDAKITATLAKYQHSIQLQTKINARNQKEGTKIPSPEPELHGLEPLPQPIQAPREVYIPAFDFLPSWIGEPRVITSQDAVKFEDLSLSKKVKDNLSRKEYTKALPVQSVVLPLMLKGPEKYYGDICVSAPTGSGKTMAYVLPLIENLLDRLVRKMSALIIVPTRELVNQAQEVAKICAVGTGVKFGAAVGNVALATEQSILLHKGQKYKPEAAKEMHHKAAERIRLGYDEDDSLLEDVVHMLPGHIPEYTSEVDVLICTPGRLVDHIRSTPGFTLEHVEWLVIDEVDQLLNQNFQDFVNVLHAALFPSKKYDQMTALEKIHMSVKGRFEHRFVQKVILSATMTRNLTQLANLKLHRPTLIASQCEVSNEPGTIEANGGFELPSLLEEYAIPVGDGSDKPLYLVQLLQGEFDLFSLGDENPVDKDFSTNFDSDSSSEFSSEPDDKTGYDSATRASSDGVETQTMSKIPGNSEIRSSKRRDKVLVFTSSNDNASRLKYLLSKFLPKSESLIGTLTKFSASSSSQKVLNSFRCGKIKVLIASDRGSRGLDVPGLASVVNYDMPSSVTSYVHRVGRTARAGKSGAAWTLYTDTEARWFWKSIAQGVEIQRGWRIVKRMRIDTKKLESKRATYQKALIALQTAVQGSH